MQIRIGETTYEVAALTKLSLLDVMKVNTELKPYGMSFASIEALTHKDPEEIDETDQMWVIGAVIWATRRIAREPVTFEEAVDIPMDSFEFIGATDEADDETADVEPDPTAAASGQDAAARRTATKTTPRTSKRTSEAASRS